MLIVSKLKKLLAIVMIFAILVVAFSTTASAASTHKVVSGDTMWKIAVRYQVGVSEIISATPEYYLWVFIWQVKNRTF